MESLIQLRDRRVRGSPRVDRRVLSVHCDSSDEIRPPRRGLRELAAPRRRLVTARPGTHDSMSAPGPGHPTRRAAPARAPGLLLGLGLGGFVDGIVLHQILQWHHMVSATGTDPVTTLAGLEANTVADGLFHLATWLFVVAGSSLMLSNWRRGHPAPTWRSQVGLLLTGWGVFNLVEGVVDHQVLGVHHVRDDLGAPLSWDLGFLALGVLLVAGGWTLHRAGQRELPERSAVRRR